MQLANGIIEPRHQSLPVAQIQKGSYRKHEEENIPRDQKVEENNMISSSQERTIFVVIGNIKP